MSKLSSQAPIRILLVEDSETDVKIILRALEKQKLSCLVENVVDGQDALDYLLNKGRFVDDTEYPYPDIILLDVNMPRMDGHTFVREIRNVPGAKDIPIVVLTTKEGMKDLFKIEGVDNYVMKSIEGREIVDKIKEILDFKQEFFNE